MHHVSAVKQAGKPHILVVPLDWGLGHATRCIPLIHELLRQNAAVWLAGEQAQERLLKQEFPDLPFLPLKGYRVRYAPTRLGLIRSILFQLPGIMRSIKEEKNWLVKNMEEYHFDAVISDNRYGLHHQSVYTIFITHQLAIKTSLGSWMDKWVQKRNYLLIKQFNECWVPDLNTKNGLAGELSHPALLPQLPVYYLGCLSRLRKNTTTSYTRNHLFISLSGPEPQRSLLENKIVDAISKYPGTATIVRGLPGSASLIPSTNDIRFFNHLPTEDYNREMESAEFVISRSGYSTVMDIAQLGKKSILVPTPGQPEQEYLAEYLMQQGFAFYVKQQGFQLREALHEAASFDYKPLASVETALSSTVGNLLAKIGGKKAVQTD